MKIQFYLKEWELMALHLSNVLFGDLARIEKDCQRQQ